MTYLAPELLVSGEVTVMAKSLLQECQKNGDNDTRFQCLTEQDEEDFRKGRRISIAFISHRVENSWCAYQVQQTH